MCACVFIWGGTAGLQIQIQKKNSNVPLSERSGWHTRNLLLRLLPSSQWHTMVFNSINSISLLVPAVHFLYVEYEECVCTRVCTQNALVKIFAIIRVCRRRCGAHECHAIHACYSFTHQVHHVMSSYFVFLIDCPH